MDISFNVSGTTGSVTAASLSMTGSHTWVGDLDARLIAPNATEHVIFSRTGITTATGCGDSSDFIGPYNFTDTATGTNWWAAAGTAGATVAVPAGDYRTTAAGPQGTATNSPATSLNTAFAGVANANGTWILRVTDFGGGDTGSITAASLTLTTAAPAPSGNGRADFDGDGKTDISTFRGSDGVWYLNQSTAGFGGINWGIAGDVIAPGDYDGDGKTDVAVFRAAADPAAPDFYVLNSGTLTVAGVSWGLAGDIPVVADYDGDGKSDYAVYRPSDQTWYILRSSDGGNTLVGGAVGTPVPADYDGDGKADIVNFVDGTWTGTGSAGAPINVVFGSAGDIAVPGNFDGDDKVDHAVFRPSTGEWFYLSSDTGSTVSAPFGATGDIPVPGDYDGDGKDDFAIYRNGVWWINRSTAGLAVIGFGLPTDIPVVASARP